MPASDSPDSLDDQPRYRIEFSLQRCLPGEEDFVEIGFGSSGDSGSIAAASYAVESDLTNGQWETSPGMPDPGDVG